MSKSKCNDEQLLDALQGVFRTHGFEGASLSMISEATGLQRASLYHRFPGGKADMALCVLRRVHDTFTSHVLAPLSEAGDPEKRLKATAQRISEFFAKGRNACLWEAMSLGSPTDGIRDIVNASFQACLKRLAAVARETGATPAAARQRAEDAIALLQGALILSRATDNPKPFQRIMKALPSVILPAAEA